MLTTSLNISLTLITTFRHKFLFTHFPWKMISIGCLISMTFVLGYFHIVNFLFIFWWTLKQLVSNSQLYLIFIATYNFLLYICCIYIAIYLLLSTSLLMFFYTFVLFWYQNIEVVSFFLLLQYSIKIFFRNDASINFCYFCQHYFIINNH